MPNLPHPYQYKCIDKSILLPYFKKYYAVFFLKFIPHSITANSITLISSLSMWIVLYFAFNASLWTQTALIVSYVFFVHFYLVGDHLDGMQAKRTNTSSPLGEFLDHYFDVYNSAILLTGFYFLIQNTVNPFPNYFVLYLGLWLSYLAFGITMLEQKKNGTLYFGPLGSLEGALIMLLFFLFFLIPEVSEFWLTPFWKSYPKYWIFAGIGFLGFIITIFDVILRIKVFPLSFIIFTSISFLLILFVYILHFSIQYSWFFLAAYSGDYIGRVITSHLAKSKFVFPNILTSLGIVILFLCHITNILSYEWILRGTYFIFFYISLVCIYNFITTFRIFSIHWSWVNQ